MLYKEVFYDKLNKEDVCCYFFLVNILCKLLFLVYIVLFRYLGMNFSTSGMYSYRSKF